MYEYVYEYERDQFSPVFLSISANDQARKPLVFRKRRPYASTDPCLIRFHPIF